MVKGKDVWGTWLQRDMEERQIGNRTVYTFSKMKNSFYEMLCDTATKYPDKIGIVDNWNREYTYQKFLVMVNQLAAYMKHILKVEKGNHIGLLLNNGIEFATAIYAVCKLGAVAVTLPTKYREPEIQSLVKKADLKFIFVSEDYKVWTSFYTECGIKVILTENEKTEYGFTYLAMQKEKEESGEGELEDEVILMFTSGTTSTSKGVILKNYNINHAIMIYQRILELGEDDRTIIPVPIYHITGLVALLGLFVYIGGTVYLHKRYDAYRILSAIQEHEITFLHGSPTVFGLLLELKNKFSKNESIRVLACGSSYMPVETMMKLHQWMPQMTFHRIYGMTETSSPATIFPSDAATSIYAKAQGKPIPGMELKIVDDSGKEVPCKEIGNVQLKGTNICESYYHIEKSPIDKEGWLDTGDMGYLNEDSYLYIVDRKKDMINRGGEKIWCNDVENEITSLKGVKESALVGIPSEKYGEVAAAVVVLEKESKLTEEDIKQKLHDRIAKYMIPEKILFLEKIPKTPGLKTDKRAIRALFFPE